MNKYKVIIRREDNTLVESFVYGNSAKEVKAIEGVIAVEDQQRVKHPTPSVLKAVIAMYEEAGAAPTLTDFYAKCEKEAYNQACVKGNVVTGTAIKD